MVSFCSSCSLGLIKCKDLDLFCTCRTVREISCCLYDCFWVLHRVYFSEQMIDLKVFVHQPSL